jgi:hypothetical protein
VERSRSKKTEEREIKKMRNKSDIYSPRKNKAKKDARNEDGKRCGGLWSSPGIACRSHAR